MDEAYSAEGERPPTEPDDALDRASVLFQHNPGFRQAFLRILQRCRDEAVELANLEATVEEVPGYPKLKQPPYFPIRWLHETGALEELYLDSDGRLHDGAEVAELDEDAFDDLVVAFAYRTTELGSKLAERFSPRNRLAQLLFRIFIIYFIRNCLLEAVLRHIQIIKHRHKLTPLSHILAYFFPRHFP